MSNYRIKSYGMGKIGKPEYKRHFLFHNFKYWKTNICPRKPVLYAKMSICRSGQNVGPQSNDVISDALVDN